MEDIPAAAEPPRRNSTDANYNPSSSDDEEGAQQPDGKRRRKSTGSQYRRDPVKRREQNRNAQRAFRARAESLEETVAHLEGVVNRQADEKAHLEVIISQLRAQIVVDHAEASSSSSSSALQTPELSPVDPLQVVDAALIKETEALIKQSQVVDRSAAWMQVPTLGFPALFSNAEPSLLTPDYTSVPETTSALDWFASAPTFAPQ